ncbi:MAG: DUF4349 domain-containing protein [Acidobacteria bacterium]|nr:DUF4349 domain-containing protein [Acidobacteriota bacterium]
MTRTDHQAALEDLMADVDGELTPAQSAAVRAHVAGCRECREVEAKLRDVAGRLATWTIEEPPAGLKSPAAVRPMARLRRWLPIAAALVVATGAGTMWLASQRDSPVRAMPAAMGAAGDTVSPRSIAAKAVSESFVQVTPLLARTARLVLVVTGFDTARAEVERVVAAAEGFVGNLTISGDRGSPQSLRATLRVPGPALDATLAQLKRLGRVTIESRDAGDVTQQSADLDARLTNARTSEKRLNDILANRTGDVTDVLNVEREIARVRGDIEKMEATRRNLDRRITFATIQLEMVEEAKAELGLGDQSLSGRLRNAAVEGWNTALDSVFEAALFIAQVAPTMMLWGLALVIPYRMVRRRLAR